jgi:hypothetical protein
MEEYASFLHSKGYLPVPVNRAKEPMKGCMWKTWGWDRISKYFENAWGVAVRTDDFEVIDIDNKLGTALDIFNYLKATHPFILKATIARSQSYGYHIFYRCQPDSSKKLAFNKSIYNEWECTIETRGKGGFIVIAPSKGYAFINNDLFSIPFFSDKERLSLLSTCRSLNRKPIRKEKLPDLDLNTSGVIQEAKSLLRGAGWKFDGRHVTRPGKKHGTSATFGIVAPGVFYVFSANGGEFESDRAYSSFQVVAKLKFNNNFKEAAKYCKERFG